MVRVVDGDLKRWVRLLPKHRKSLVSSREVDMTTRWVGEEFKVGEQVRTFNGSLGRIKQVRSRPHGEYDGRGDVWVSYVYLVEVEGEDQLWPWDYLTRFSLLDELAEIREG